MGSGEHENSKSLLLSTVNSSPTVEGSEARGVHDTKNEIIPGISSEKTEEQGKRSYSLSQEMSQMFLD